MGRLVILARVTARMTVKAAMRGVASLLRINLDPPRQTKTYN